METISRDLEALTAFHIVATAGSFTQAAEAVGSSKALLSKQVKRLETNLRTQLFHRTTRSVTLTEEGTALLNFSRKIFDLSEEASRRLRDMTQGLSGLIRISAPVSLGDIIFPELLAEAGKLLPQVKFELDLSNENRDFLKDGIDFALRAIESEHPDLVTRHLGRIKDVICASPEFVKKTKIGKDPKELAQLECILHSNDPAWNIWTLSSDTGDVRVEVKGRNATNQYTMAHLLCTRGGGIARIPLYVVAKDLAKGNLVQLFPDYEIATHPLFLVHVRGEYATQKHRMTKDLILNWFKKNREIFI